MLTLQIPTLLALLGTALMAVVIFAPAPVDAKATVSLAPPFTPPAPAPLERWNSASGPLDAWNSPSPLDAWNSPSPLGAWNGPSNDALAQPALDAPAPHELAFEDADVTAPHAAAAWPELVDARATSCDAAGRLALVDALATVRAPWADAVLQRALDDEPDAHVRDAIVAALRGVAER